jgi:peptidoglycan/LPS O-acetylase OafA/YrhL
MLHIPTDFVTPVEPEQTLARFLVNGASAFLLLLPAILNTRRRPSTILATMRAAPLVWLGTISYGLYLWHKPVITEIRHDNPNGLEFWPLLAATMLASIALSWVSYHLVEKPAQRLRLPNAGRHARRRVVWRTPARRANTS